MKNAKKLIVASVLSMMTASCNDKLGIKLAGDQNIPADVFPMTVNIAAYQA
ncbi:hypothetical protein QTB36_003709 [Salmonella enterica]|nr:hypothetical protein [Salmonella enterica]ELT3405090.1 hypothetical protein [Salmonella enterica]